MKCKNCGKLIRLNNSGQWMHVKGTDFCAPELITKAEVRDVHPKL